MSNLDTEDYLYIEAIGIVLYYYELEKEKRNKYIYLLKESLMIVTSKETFSKELINELLMQEAIAFRIPGQEVIRADSTLNSNLSTLLKYVGNLKLDIVINVKNYEYKIGSKQITEILK